MIFMIFDQSIFVKFMSRLGFTFTIREPSIKVLYLAKLKF